MSISHWMTFGTFAEQSYFIYPRKDTAQAIQNYLMVRGPVDKDHHGEPLFEKRHGHGADHPHRSPQGRLFSGHVMINNSLFYIVVIFLRCGEFLMFSLWRTNLEWFWVALKRPRDV